MWWRVRALTMNMVQYLLLTIPDLRGVFYYTISDVGSLGLYRHKLLAQKCLHYFNFTPVYPPGVRSD